MELTAPAINRILELAEVREHSIDGKIYTERRLDLVQPPQADALHVGTLNGLVQLMEAGFDGFDPAIVLLHVVSHEEVRLQSLRADSYGRRQVFVECKAQKGEREFKFNSYYSVEDFNIALRSMFVQSNELDKLVELAGKIVADDKVVTVDDGFSQKVTAKTGVGPFKGERVVKPRVTLAPFRTFRELLQPTSEYIFRVRTTEQGVACALFEADGGAWKLSAIDTIAAWLRTRRDTSSVESLHSVPVIA